MAKVFDTILHNSLIHKLSYYGFSVASYNLFASYLSKRFLQVKGTNKYMRSTSYYYGCTPRFHFRALFLIYVNDMPSIVKYYCKARTVDDAYWF